MTMTSKKLEDILNLPPMDENLEEAENPLAEPELPENALEKPKAIIDALTVAEKINTALPMVQDLNEHDEEMDKIAKEALAAYEEFKTLGLEVPSAFTGRILEVAATMLQTAMQAKDAKVNRKLKMLELQLKKLRIDKIHNSEDENSKNNQFDREELLKFIVDANAQNVKTTVKPPETDK